MKDSTHCSNSHETPGKHKLLLTPHNSHDAHSINLIYIHSFCKIPELESQNAEFLYKIDYILTLIGYEANFEKFVGRLY